MLRRTTYGVIMRARISTRDGATKVKDTDRDSNVGQLTGEAAASSLSIDYATALAWYDRIVRWRMAAPVRTQRAGLAVRRDWPQTGHDFVAFGMDADAALWWIDRDGAFWRRGPVRPLYSLVRISAHDFYLHRRRPPCRTFDCPQPMAQPVPYTMFGVGL